MLEAVSNMASPAHPPTPCCSARSQRFFLFLPHSSSSGCKLVTADGHSSAAAPPPLVHLPPCYPPPLHVREVLNERLSSSSAADLCQHTVSVTPSRPCHSSGSSNVSGLQQAGLGLFNMCTMHSVMFERPQPVTTVLGCSPALDEAPGDYWSHSVKPQRRLPWMTTRCWGENKLDTRSLSLLPIGPLCCLHQMSCIRIDSRSSWDRLHFIPTSWFNGVCFLVGETKPLLRRIMCILFTPNGNLKTITVHSCLVHVN